MATAKSISKPRKKKVVRGAPRIKRGSKLTEPSWEEFEKLTGEEFHRKQLRDRSWYYENFKSTDLYPAVSEWMSTRPDEYSEDDIKAVKVAPTHALSVSAAITAKLMLNGMPDYFEPHNTFWVSLKGTMGEIRPMSKFLKERITHAISAGAEIVAIKKEEAKDKVGIYVPTIQDRMRESCIIMASEIEEFVVSFIETYDMNALKEFEPITILRKEQAKAGHARLIKTWYQGERDEIHELVNFPTPAKFKKLSEQDQDLALQLKEGYSHLGPKKIKAMLEMFQRILDACDIVSVENKAQRKPRQAKLKSADQLIKKLKFKMSDTDYGIASIPPEKLIGANVAMIFNCKNRKIGLYYASNVDPKGMGRPGSGFSVKGTTLLGYDEEKSVQRTVRKTAEFLPVIKKTTKSKTEKLFQTLKTTETKLNGRFNDETVILAVF